MVECRWEAVVTSLNNCTNNGEDDTLQIYVPGENLFLDVLQENLRVSRDWVGGKWADVKEKPDILSSISAVVDSETRVCAASAPLHKDDKLGPTTLIDDMPLKADDMIRIERAGLVDLAPSGGGRDDLTVDKCDMAMANVLPTSAVVAPETEVPAVSNDDGNVPPKTNVDENKSESLTTLDPTGERHADLIPDDNQPSVGDNSNGGVNDRAKDRSEDHREDKLDERVNADEKGAEPMAMAI